MSAVHVCSKMRTMRDNSGKKMFSKKEGVNQADPSPAQDEEEDFVVEAEQMSTRFEIRRHLKL